MRKTIPSGFPQDSGNSTEAARIPGRLAWFNYFKGRSHYYETIGLIGGMSWESTQTYYQLINQRVRDELGGLHSARLVLYSVDFAEIEALQHHGDWATTGEILGAVGKALAAAGADFIVLCTNTMHKVADSIEKASGLPMLHIADATADALHRDGIDCVGLLGTKFTMEQAFYKERLENRGIRVLVPDDAQRALVHTVIYESYAVVLSASLLNRAICRCWTHWPHEERKA